MASTPLEASASAASEPKAESSEPALTILGDNKNVIARYEILKDDANNLVVSVQNLMSKNRAILSDVRAGEPIPADAQTHLNEIRMLSEQAVRQFGQGLSSPPFGHCGIMAGAAKRYWDTLLDAKLNGETPPEDVRSEYEEDLTECKEEIATPPQATVTIKIPAGSEPPGTACHRVPQLNKKNVDKASAIYICPASQVKTDIPQITPPEKTVK